MSVLIKMDMPKSCPCELVGVGYDLYCSFVCGSPARLKEYDECCQNNTRPAWCPLLEVQAHGRLIDADALKDLYHYNTQDSDIDKAWIGNIRRSIDNAPTVIETEAAENA